MSDPTSDDWRVVANDNGVIVVNQAGHCVAIIPALAGVNEPVRDIQAQVADAHLIAAARNMLAVLRELTHTYEAFYQVFDPLSLGQGWMSKAVAAIAKAEGRA